MATVDSGIDLEFFGGRKYLISNMDSGIINRREYARLDILRSDYVHR